MLKTIKKSLLLSLFVFSSAFTMRQVAQVALARTLNQQSASFRNSLVPRCPVTSGMMFLMVEAATEIEARAMVVEEIETISTVADESILPSSGLTQGSSDCSLANKHFVMDHQNAVSDNQVLADLKKDNAIRNAHLHLDRHLEPVANNWQPPSSADMVYDRLHRNARESSQHLSQIVFNARLEQLENEHCINTKSQCFSCMERFAPIVEDKVRHLVSSYSSLSRRELSVQIGVLTRDLPALESKFLSLAQKNPNIYFIVDATRWGLESRSIPYHLKDKWTIQDTHEVLTALELKSDIEAIKIACQECNDRINKFEQEAHDFVNKVESLSLDVIEREIIPDIVAKKEANDILIVQKENELTLEKNKLGHINAQLESFNARSIRAKCGAIIKGMFKPDHRQDLLVAEQNCAMTQQGKISRELEPLYDKQKEYAAQIEQVQKIVDQKKQIEIQEAQLVQEKQNQEVLIFYEQMTKSHYDCYSFDIADCPYRQLEKQWIERQEALSQTKEQDYKQYDQSFNFSPQAVGFLAAHDIDYKEFQSFFGTALQQQFHGEICSIFEKAAILHRDLPYQSNFLQSSILLADAAHDANKLEQIQMVIALNNLSFQFLDTAESYSLAVISGVIKGVQNAIIHPIETIVALPHTVESLAKGLYYVFETAALNGCAEEFGFDDLYVDLRDQRNAEIAAGLRQLGHKISESSGPERVEALVSFGTECYVSGKVMHAAGGVLGVLRSEVKLGQATEAVAAMAGEQAGLSEAGRELAQTMQKMEQVVQEKVAQETAEKLFRTTKKQKHPKKLARVAIEGSTGKPTPARTLQQKAEDAVNKAENNKNVRKRTLFDGRKRYYYSEEPSSTLGPTRGMSKVIEHNPNSGTVRCWMECYDYNGNVNRVHPKMINGIDVISQHYPVTYQDQLNNIKGMKWLTPGKSLL